MIVHRFVLALRYLLLPVVFLLKGLVRFYQLAISPLTNSCCRYEPSCSSYCIEALDKHHLWGVFLCIYRICRCNPLCKGGYDPVPSRLLFFKRPDESGE